MFKKRISGNKDMFLTVILILFSSMIIAQTLEKDSTDIYLQHVIIAKGDKFLFDYHNTSPRHEIASYDNSKEKPLKVSFNKLDYNVQAFWLRHPILIRPYTEYVFKYKVLVKKKPESLPVIEFAVFDDSRETQVESYICSLKNIGEWQEGAIRFITANQARFARIRIEAKKSDSPGDVYFKAMELEQLSESLAFKPKPISIIAIENYNFLNKKEIIAEKKMLPSKEYYSISSNISWHDFIGDCNLVIEWLDESLESVGKEVCLISNMNGLLAKWDGIELQWKKQDATYMGWISRQKDKFFNEDGNSGDFTYKTFKPLEAKFLKVYHEKNTFSGKIKFNEFSIDAEF
jgi:hypothetical protein